MKKVKKFFSVVVMFAMLLGAMGSVNMKDVYASGENKKAVISIDAGRKYFSEEQLKQIIDKAYQNGYTDVQICLGNDALRFFLDDMSITVGDKIYASEDVKSAITAGNNSYYQDPNGGALTQDEMNRITAYTKEKGLHIIPVINSPGHMDSILVAMEQLGIENVRYQYISSNGTWTSQRTVNIQNEEAVAFVKELVKKYVNYFAGTGAVEIFNFGADEFANDVFGSPGWFYIWYYQLYDKFIAYINDLSAIIKDASMTPMCFNDGIYYGGDGYYYGNYKYTDWYNGVIDTDIIVSYWTSGWNGFNVASAKYLSDKGFKIMNTNDAWYWVLGLATDNDGYYNYEKAMKGINDTSFTSVTGANGDVPTIGSTQAIWCDTPSKSHDMETIFKLMDAYSTQNSDYLIRPADYSKVDEAISKVPEDLSVYTDETVAKLQEALNNVVRNKRITEQEVVDGYAEAINTAINSLVKKPTSKPIVSENESNSSQTNNKKDDSKSAVKTGDSADIYAWLSLITISSFAAVLTLRKRKVC